MGPYVDVIATAPSFGRKTVCGARLWSRPPDVVGGVAATAGAAATRGRDTCLSDQRLIK